VRSGCFLQLSGVPNRGSPSEEMVRRAEEDRVHEGTQRIKAWRHSPLWERRTSKGGISVSKIKSASGRSVIEVRPLKLQMALCAIGVGRIA
jgi:hypothetical protein